MSLLHRLAMLLPNRRDAIARRLAIATPLTFDEARRLLDAAGNYAAAERLALDVFAAGGSVDLLFAGLDVANDMIGAARLTTG